MAPSNQDPGSSKATLSVTGRRGKNVNHTITLLSNVMMVKWSKVLNFAGNTIVLQVGSQGKRSLAFASEDVKNMFLDVYIRLRMTWLFDLVELNFSLHQYPGNPSIRASLRTQIRVKRLPLEEFFIDIYGHRHRRRDEQLQERRISTQEEQLHLFSVAQKLLLGKFYAGEAFPNAIDANGHTLLHVRP